MKVIKDYCLVNNALMIYLSKNGKYTIRSLYDFISRFESKIDIIYSYNPEHIPITYDNICNIETKEMTLTGESL